MNGEKKDLEQRRCPECQKKFTPRVAWQIYDRAPCRSKANVRAFWQRQLGSTSKVKA